MQKKTGGSLLLELEHVAKRYQTPGAAEAMEVLKDVSLQVAQGESLAIMGPSGSGKSTLLNIIGTLDRPTSGRVRVDGQDLLAFQEERLAAVRNRDIGFIFQAHHLLPQCTLLENVLVPSLVCQDPDLKASAGERARTLLERVGLGARWPHRPAQLSGGERQRAAVVRALINRPKLLLADEPTGALDRISAEALAGLLQELNRELGVTLIAVTHAPELARRLGRVLELRDGVLEPARAEWTA